MCTSGLLQQFFTAWNQTCLSLTVLVKLVLPSQAARNTAAPEELLSVVGKDLS